MAEAMLQRGRHPNAVRNRILKVRLGQFFESKDVNQDQKRLDEEEPRCKSCGVTEDNHQRWMDAFDNGDSHPFQAKKKTRS